MLEKLACSLGRKDEEPNIALAQELAGTKNKKGIREITGGLHKEEPIANDCIKVLYEIGALEPELIAEYAGEFIQLLESKNNRLVWGSMTALSKVVSINPDAVYKNLDIVIQAYQKGSVITVDNSISVFAELVKAGKKYEKKVFPLIVAHLEKCRSKEVAQHAERAFVCINEHNAQKYREVLLKRFESLTAAQQKRVEKLLLKLRSEK